MKETYNVICPFDKSHKLKVVLEVEESKEKEGSKIDVYCPTCDKYVRVPLEKQLKPDRVVTRGHGNQSGC